MQDRKFTALVYLGVTFYIILCGLNFLSQRPLWLDENFIMDNLKHLQGFQLFGPLQHSQAFPRFYLLLIQKISLPFNYSVAALRFLPLLFMILAFVIWLKIYREEEGRSTGYLLFILAWCGSYYMSYYAAELKQYSADVLAAGLFSYFILNQKKHLKVQSLEAKIIWGYLFLPALLLFSYTAYFFILIPTYNLLLRSRSSKNNKLYLCIYSFSIMFFGLASFNLDLKYTFGNTDLQNYWKDYFISTSSIYEFIKSFTEGLRNIFVRWFLKEKPVIQIMTIFFPFGLFNLVFRGFKEIKQNRGRIESLMSISLILIIGLFIAGILKTYPFTGTRITLFIATFIFYAIIKALELFKGEPRFKPLYFVLISLYIGTLFFTSFYLLNSYLSKLS